MAIGAERDRGIGTEEEALRADPDREADDMPDPDPEEASICLTCRRRRCLLDEDRPCLRYRRGMRALRNRRSVSAGTAGLQRKTCAAAAGDGGVSEGVMFIEGFL